MKTLHWNGSIWRTVSVPSPETHRISSHFDLNNVLALASDNVWAVGSGYSNGQTLIRHWDGDVWSSVPSPQLTASNNHLYGIAAVTKDDIWAVGHANIPEISYGWGTVVHTLSASEAQTLILHWDGGRWSGSRPDVESAWFSPVQAQGFALSA